MREDESVWPPPPWREGEERAAAIPEYRFRTINRRLEGQVPTLVQGTLFVTDEGLVIDGKSAPAHRWQVILLLSSCLFCCFGFPILVLVLIVMESRPHPEKLVVRWEDVVKIVLSPDSQEVCIVYRRPLPDGLSETFSLAFVLTHSNMTDFDAALEPLVGSKILSGSVAYWMPPAQKALIACLFFQLLALFLVIFGPMIGIWPHHW